MLCFFALTAAAAATEPLVPPREVFTNLLPPLFLR